MTLNLHTKDTGYSRKSWMNGDVVIGDSIFTAYESQPNKKTPGI